MQLSQKTPITTLTNVSGEILAQICSYLDDWTCQGKNESVHGRPSHYALALTCRALSTLIRPLMYSKMSFDCSHKSGLDSLKLLSQELSDSPNMINLINSVRLWCILPGSQANARLSRFLDVLAGSESLNRFELTGWPQDLVHCSVIPLVCSGGFRRLRNLSILADRHSGSTSVGAAAPLFNHANVEETRTQSQPFRSWNWSWLRWEWIHWARSPPLQLATDGKIIREDSTARLSGPS